MRQWSKVLLLSMIANIPMPSQSTSQNHLQKDISDFYSNKKMFDLDIPGFEYLKKYGVETLNIPDGIPLDLEGFKRVSDLYGPRFHPIHKKWLNHSGIDFSGYVGTDIYATGTGTIVHAGHLRGYGRTIIVDHGGGVETLYAHLNEYNVQEGDKVLKGDVIGKLGNSGVSTGSHLHYELRINDKSTDPLALLVGEDTKMAICEADHIIKSKYKSNEELANQGDIYYCSASDVNQPEKTES